jgi:hypothetical protein
MRPEETAKFSWPAKVLRKECSSLREKRIFYKTTHHSKVSPPQHSKSHCNPSPSPVSRALRKVLMPHLFFFVLFCFWQYLSLNSRLHLEPLHQPFLWWVFFKTQIDNYLGWLWTAILLTSASWVARIISVSHWHLATHLLIVLELEFELIKTIFKRVYQTAYLKFHTKLVYKQYSMLTASEILTQKKRHFQMKTKEEIH